MEQLKGTSKIKCVEEFIEYKDNLNGGDTYKAAVVMKATPLNSR